MSTASSTSPTCTEPPKRGDKVLLVPGHCDPTVNLHDWYVGVRGFGTRGGACRKPLAGGCARRRVLISFAGNTRACAIARLSSPPDMVRQRHQGVMP